MYLTPKPLAMPDKDLLSVQSLEQAFQLPLPGALRKHLVEGAHPFPGNAIYDYAGDIAYLGEALNASQILEIRKAISEDVLPVAFVPITEEAGGNLVCVDLASEGGCVIYYVDFEYWETPSRMYSKLASSFEEFVAKLSTVD